ncbi:MAG: cellulase family glycosylhydrolase [Bacteroidetes bacterium]|nr:cellulase family glycosylhydrolase [Bacteroidota bacterium]
MQKTGIIILLFFCSIIATAQSPDIWSKEKAKEWYKKQGWLVGADFLPSTAINQLEMWQAETFDTATINRELGWAHTIGMNVMRVYLHDLAWQADPEGFKNRMNTYLTIASRNKIKTLFTIFDDCWNPDPVIGKQPDPKPGVHNSGWVRSPGKSVHNDPTQWGYLEKYVKDVLTTYKNDDRILMWDLYNEPGNSDYKDGSMPLLKKVFEWAWAVRPSQPLTAATWADYKDLNRFQLESSDVITIHNYNDATDLEKELKEKLKLGRPIICSEYMARPRNSRFQTHLPLFKKYNVGAINWGLVSGKSNTIYQWSKPIPDGSEPALWFHDVFRKDGTPYDKKETDFIKAITAK